MLKEVVGSIRDVGEGPEQISTLVDNFA